MFVSVLFYALATILVAAGVGVITARNPVHAALSLVLCFCTSAVLWLLIEAEFLAIVLVLVYVGAVMVLFLSFGRFMLLKGRACDAGSRGSACSAGFSRPILLP